MSVRGWSLTVALNRWTTLPCLNYRGDAEYGCGKEAELAVLGDTGSHWHTVTVGTTHSAWMARVTFRPEIRAERLVVVDDWWWFRSWFIFAVDRLMFRPSERWYFKFFFFFQYIDFFIRDSQIFCFVFDDVRAKGDWRARKTIKFTDIYTTNLQSHICVTSTIDSALHNYYVRFDGFIFIHFLFGSSWKSFVC